MPASLQTLVNPISQLRDELRCDRAALEQKFLQHGSVARQLGVHSRLIDQYLRRVWDALALPANIALVAVGGYGRAELAPKSDLDLLILLDETADELLQAKLSELVTQLWDMGLEVGHSIRTLDECVSESRDITVQTNLLEARLICGDAKLFDALQVATKNHLIPCNFFNAKLKEQQQRHARFVDADFNLEPNLKESPGGLRDLQTVMWISRAAGLGTTWQELAKSGLISVSEAKQIARHDNLLKNYRSRLHYLAKRREDRLLFDFQTPLAEQLGIDASAHRRASEHLMQRYYQTRRAVRQFNTIVLQNLHDYLFKETPLRHPLNERFSVVGTLLDIPDEQLFEHTPAAIFELFLLLQQHPELTDLSAKTLRAVWRAQAKIDTVFRRDAGNRARFMEIFRQPQGLLHVLRRMNQYGILGRYIP
ncbi:MAG: nucleotidyltransferase domain-containing protein, partial [Gallionella sp.]